MDPAPDSCGTVALDDGGVCAGLRTRTVAAHLAGRSEDGEDAFARTPLDPTNRLEPRRRREPT